MTAKQPRKRRWLLVRPPTMVWTGMLLTGGESTRSCVGFRPVS